MTADSGSSTRAARAAVNRALRKARQRPASCWFTASAEQRIAQLGAETPIGGRRYTVAGVAAALKRSERAVAAMVARGALPPADAEHGTWLASTIEPALVALGCTPGGAHRDAELALARHDPIAAAALARPRTAAATEARRRAAPIEHPALPFELGDVPDWLDLSELVPIEPELVPIAEPEEPEEPAPFVEPERLTRSDGAKRSWLTRRGLAPPAKRPKRDRRQYVRDWQRKRWAAIGYEPCESRVLGARRMWERRKAAAAAEVAAT